MADRRPEPSSQSTERGESRWPVNLTVAAAIGVQLMLSRDLSMRPSWLLPLVEAAILVALLAEDPTQRVQRRPRPLRLHLVLTSVLSLATVVVLWQLVDALIHGCDLPEPFARRRLSADRPARLPFRFGVEGPPPGTRRTVRHLLGGRDRALRVTGRGSAFASLPTRQVPTVTLG